MNFVRTIPQKVKYAQTITNDTSKILKQSRLKPNLIETDDKCEIKNFSMNSQNGIVIKDFLDLLRLELYMLEDSAEIYIIY